MFHQIHPEGKIPALLSADGQVIIDSTVIVNYLDKKYPNPPLYNKEFLNRDLELLEHYDKVLLLISLATQKGLIYQKNYLT